MVRDAHEAIRRLGPQHMAALGAHFRRLDSESRVARFHGWRSDASLATYVARRAASADPVLGAFAGDRLIGVVELCPDLGRWPLAAELALSVEPDFRRRGLGAALAGRALLAARNSWISRLEVHFTRDNLAMRKIALGLGGVVRAEDGALTAEIAAPWPNWSSFAEEGWAEGRGLIDWAFRLPKATLAA